MLKRLSERERIEQLLVTFQPKIRLAFLDAIAEIVSQIVLRRLVERLERGDLFGAIEALEIEGAAYGSLVGAVTEAYNAGGIAIVGGMPTVRGPDGAKAVLRFDVRDPGAEKWIRQHSSQLITEVVADQRLAAQIAMQSGLQQGRGPAQVALDIAGRINRATGRREGGIIGLTSVQVDYVSTARQELLSGDPELMRHYLSRGRRDKRFDKAVIAAIKDGKPLDATAVNRIAGRYSDRLVQLRAETISRTEGMEAIEASHYQSYRQTIDRLGLDPLTDVEKEWRATSGGRTRDTHAILHGATVAGLDTPFRSVSGAQLRYPGDRSLGAPASEIVNCRCYPIYRLRFERARR